jgi:energy-coupling factor transporter transmembrane protein EcfT
VETEVFDTHLLHELETGIHLVLGCLHLVGITIPRELFRTATKLVTTLLRQVYATKPLQTSTSLSWVCPLLLIGIIVMNAIGFLLSLPSNLQSFLFRENTL